MCCSEPCLVLTATFSGPWPASRRKITLLFFKKSSVLITGQSAPHLVNALGLHFSSAVTYSHTVESLVLGALLFQINAALGRSGILT